MYDQKWNCHTSSHHLKEIYCNNHHTFLFPRICIDVTSYRVEMNCIIFIMQHLQYLGSHGVEYGNIVTLDLDFNTLKNLFNEIFGCHYPLTLIM